MTLLSIADLDNVNVYVCPGSKENLNRTIINPAQFSFMYESGHLWALNNRRKPTFESLKVGDRCIFGNADMGWGYVASVKSKIEIPENTDEWTFKSPSGKPWTKVFYLNTPERINISHDVMKKILGYPSCQTQTKLSQEQKNRLLLEI
jgi:hypothetical protein